MSISCRHVSVVSCQVGSWLTLTITFSYSGMRSTLQHHECLSVGVQLSAACQLDVSLFDDIIFPSAPQFYHQVLKNNQIALVAYDV